MSQNQKNDIQQWGTAIYQKREAQLNSKEAWVKQALRNMQEYKAEEHRALSAYQANFAVENAKQLLGKTLTCSLGIYGLFEYLKFNQRELSPIQKQNLREEVWKQQSGLHQDLCKIHNGYRSHRNLVKEIAKLEQSAEHHFLITPRSRQASMEYTASVGIFHAFRSQIFYQNFIQEVESFQHVPNVEAQEIKSLIKKFSLKKDLFILNNHVTYHAYQIQAGLLKVSREGRKAYELRPFPQDLPALKSEFEPLFSQCRESAKIIENGKRILQKKSPRSYEFLNQLVSTYNHEEENLRNFISNFPLDFESRNRFFSNYEYAQPRTNPSIVITQIMPMPDKPKVDQQTKVLLVVLLLVILAAVILNML